MIELFHCRPFSARISRIACAANRNQERLACVGCAGLEGDGGRVVANEPESTLLKKRAKVVLPPMNKVSAPKSARKRAQQCPPPAPSAVGATRMDVETLTFAGDDAAVVRRFAALSAESGGDVASDVATILYHVLGGRMVMRKGAK